MEGQESIEHRQGAISHAKRGACFADRSEQLPFVSSGSGLYCLSSLLICQHAKRHRPPPKGRRYISAFHLLSPILRQKKSDHQNDAKDA
jgi:hypothetical protein